MLDGPHPLGLLAGPGAPFRSRAWFLGCLTGGWGSRSSGSAWPRHLVHLVLENPPPGRQALAVAQLSCPAPRRAGGLAVSVFSGSAFPGGSELSPCSAGPQVLG